MKTITRKFMADESGATAIEYGSIASCIALAIIAAVKRARHEAQFQVHVDQ